MEGHPHESVAGAQQAPLTPAGESASHFDVMPEGFTTLNGLAREVELGAIRRVRDVAEYLGLSPTVVRGAADNLVTSFSPADTETLVVFVREQERRDDGPVLGDSNS